MAILKKIFYTIFPSNEEMEAAINRMHNDFQYQKMKKRVYEE